MLVYSIHPGSPDLIDALKKDGALEDTALSTLDTFLDQLRYLIVYYQDIPKTELKCSQWWLTTKKNLNEYVQKHVSWKHRASNVPTSADLLHHAKIRQSLFELNDFQNRKLFQFARNATSNSSDLIETFKPQLMYTYEMNVLGTLSNIYL